jgi:glycerol-1-phosphate dehydrogenase [NAD(P)+]
MVQTHLRYWMADPVGVRRGDLEATRRLTAALMVTGFAMQAACSSRPVSGAEHQFSHLWDMEHHEHHGVAPSHGFKVGVGTLASLALYEYLMKAGVENIDVAAAAAAWPAAAANEREIADLFPVAELADKARLESGVKYIDRAALRAQLDQIKQAWPAMRDRLAQHLIPRQEVRDMLAAAGCPVTPDEIGISPQRLRESFLKAYHIRRRFTIFDIVRRLNLWDQALAEIFDVRKVFA